MKNATRLLVISLALMLSGCAYSPKQVEASRPLVNQTASTDLQAMAANLQQPEHPAAGRRAQRQWQYLYSGPALCLRPGAGMHRTAA